MDTFTIIDGLSLTVIAMLVVVAVLASIWGLIELVAKFVAESTTPAAKTPIVTEPSLRQTTEHSEHKKVAEIMALVMASEDQPDRKFEIVESQRIY